MTIPDTDAAREELAAADIDLRHKLESQLGYGPTGPKNLGQLTYSQIRTKVEGIRRAERRAAKRRAAMQGVDLEKEEAKQAANEEMVTEMQADLDALEGEG